MSTDTISLGSCPVCHGPAQFIANPDPAAHPSGCEFLTGGLCRCSTPDFREALAEGLHKAMCYGPTTLHNRLACERPLVYLNIANAAADHPAVAVFQGHGTVREVRLPNIDEDLGDGWVLTLIDRLTKPERGDDTWRATARLRFESNGPRHEYEFGYGESPSAAYLALRTAIEARR